MCFEGVFHVMKSDQLLVGKTAVITGCNRGIGEAVLRLFAAHGATIYACVRQPSEAFNTLLQALRDAHTVEISPFYCDFEIIEQVKAVAGQMLSNKESIHILVNNAAAIETSSFQMTSVGQIEKLYRINFIAPILLTQYLARRMRKNDSSAIVNITSTAAIDGNEGRLAYASSKAALIAATKVMGKELADMGIRVNALAPGLTLTDMMVGSTAETVQTEIVNRLAIKRIALVEEIAEAVLFLSSGMSSYMTGQVMRVDGGML